MTCVKLLCVHFNVVSARSTSLDDSIRMACHANLFQRRSKGGGRLALVTKGLEVVAPEALVRHSLFTKFGRDFGEIVDAPHENWQKTWARRSSLFNE